MKTLLKFICFLEICSPVIQKKNRPAPNRISEWGCTKTTLFQWNPLKHQKYPDLVFGAKALRNKLNFKADKKGNRNQRSQNIEEDAGTLLQMLFEFIDPSDLYSDDESSDDSDDGEIECKRPKKKKKLRA